jgi:hypothetical protein
MAMMEAANGQMKADIKPCVDSSTVVSEYNRNLLVLEPLMSDGPAVHARFKQEPDNIATVWMATPYEERGLADGDAVSLLRIPAHGNRVSVKCAFVIVRFEVEAWRKR